MQTETNDTSNCRRGKLQFGKVPSGNRKIQDSEITFVSQVSFRNDVLKVFLPLILFLFLYSYSNGQGNIKTEEVDIVKAYQPLLSDADKIDFEAQPASVDTTVQLLQYDVKSHLIEVPFIPAEIKAVSLPAEISEPVLNNLLRAGFGTQLTPLLDLYLHNGETDKFSYGLNFHHLSSNGSKIAYQDFSHTGGLLFGKAYVGGTSLSATAGYDHRKNYNYADIFIDTNDVSKKSLKRTYDYLPVELSFKNTRISKGNFNYQFNFKYHHFDDVPHNLFLLSEKEDYFNFNFTLQKQIQKIHSGNIEFSYQNLRNKAIGVFDTTQEIYSIVPFYGLKMEKLNLIAGINISVLNKEIGFFPRIRGEYKLIGDYLIPYISFEGGYKPVTMNELTTINPYLGTITTTVSKVTDAFVGMRGSYGNNISYNIKAGYQSHKNIPFFLPDSVNPGYYDVQFYYDANIINAHAEVGYRQSERFNLVLSGETNSYSLDFDDKPWGIPKSRLDFTFTYNLQNKIFASADIFANSGAYTILPGDSVSTQLPGRVDVNLSATYNYKKNIALWLAFNNITGSKNTPWYNYPSYGFQAMAGVNLKF